MSNREGAQAQHDMKVFNSNNANVAGLNRSGPKQGAVPARSSKPLDGDSDDVQLSSWGSELNSGGDVDSSVRSGMLSRISAAVSSGQYRVDSYAVSGDII